jgi:hypothetical protein
MNRFAARSSVLVWVSALMQGTSALADVTIQQQDVINLAQTMTTRAETITRISASAARIETRVSVQSLMFDPTRAGENDSELTQIVRLDEGRLFALDPERRQYEEVSLSASAARASNAQAGIAACGSVDVSLLATGHFEVIAGMNAEEFVITATRQCTRPHSQRQCSLSVTQRRWDVAALPFVDQGKSLYSRLRPDYGVDPRRGGIEEALVEQTRSSLQRMMGTTIDNRIWRAVAAKGLALPGVPIRSAIEVAASPCFIQRSKRTSGMQVGDKDLPALVKNMLLSAWMQQRDNDSEPGVLLSYVSELRSLDAAPLAASLFEIPADFSRSFVPGLTPPP